MHYYVPVNSKSANLPLPTIHLQCYQPLLLPFHFTAFRKLNNFFFLQTFYGLFQIVDAAAIIFKVLTLVIYFLLVPSSPPRNPPPPVPSFPPTTSNKMSGPPQLPPRPIPHSPVSPGRAPAPLPSPTRATAGAVGGRSATGK